MKCYLHFELNIFNDDSSAKKEDITILPYSVEVFVVAANAVLSV